MQAIFEFLVGIVAALAAAALAHLGVDLERRPAEPQEIHRTVDCPPPARSAVSTEDC